MIYELRIYHCIPGRLPALLKRFETITLDLWKRRGIRQAGFWTVLIGESNQDLYYMLAWESMAERERLFGAFMTDPEWLAKRGEGLAMLVLEGKNAEADVDAFRRAGIGDFAPFRFEREGRTPDGRAVKLGFSLAFARDPLAPDTCFFTCQQHYPENFWNPAFQAHANGAN